MCHLEIKNWRALTALMQIFNPPPHFPPCSPATLSVAFGASGSWMSLLSHSHVASVPESPTSPLLGQLLLLHSCSVLMFYDSGYRNLSVSLKMRLVFLFLTFSWFGLRGWSKKIFTQPFSNWIIISFIIIKKQKAVFILRGNHVTLLIKKCNNGKQQL